MRCCSNRAEAVQQVLEGVWSCSRSPDRLTGAGAALFVGAAAVIQCGSIRCAPWSSRSRGAVEA